MSLASFGLRGFTALSAMSALRRRFPQYANAITTAQVAGFSASQILRVLDGGKKKQDDYLTDSERAYKNYTKQKKKAAYQAAGMLAVAGGLGYAAARSLGPAAISASEITQIPNVGYGRNAGRSTTTLQHPQQQISYNPLLLGGPQQQGKLPYNPRGPQQPPSPQGQPPSPTSPIPSPAPSPQAPVEPIQQSPTLMKNVALVKNLRQENAIENFYKQGMHPLVAASILREYNMPKHLAKMLDKSEGGLDQVVQDYYQFLEQNPPQERPQFNQQQAQSQEQAPIMPPQQAQGIETPIEQTQQPIEPSAPTIQEPVAPIEEPIKPIKQIVPDIEKEIVAKLPKNLVNTPMGIGEIDHDGKAGVIANVNGKKKSFKHDDITKPPSDLEDAVRHIINSIPENEKSTNLQSATLVPLPEGNNVMIVKFYDGKVAWYTDVPEELYDNIAQGTYAPKTSGKTGIAEYKPSVVDSRGAGFSSEIARHPKYSKENKGKTWGYAKNDYDAFKMIQPIVHKISKEKLDAQGRVIQPKKRNRS